MSSKQKPPRNRIGGWVDPKKLPKNEDGRNQCRWCSKSVMPPRRTFCSDECVASTSIKDINTIFKTMCI